MKFPYGNCDFYDVITEGYFYIDRSDHIAQIENAGKHLLLLRPRRFGKSLLLSMLENYYDVAKADEFEHLFGHLAIGKHPTPRHNSYVVMNWDFSAVSPQGTPADIQRALHNHINGCIEQFTARYRDILGYEIQRDPEDALRSFQSVLTAVQSSPYKLYLLIDEYDNFANEVMMGGHASSQQRYESLLYGEGAIKTVFKAVKSAAKGLGLDRTFITGVSPVVLSDITSGYNIAENISLLPQFHDLCGFREAEIRPALREVITSCKLPETQETEALELMRAFYNGSSFSYRFDDLLYNPTLVLYFLKALQQECCYPRRMLDSNLAMDKMKITYISRLAHGRQVVLDALNGENPVNIDELADRFGVEAMLSASKDTTFMISLLYYFGVLTLTNERTKNGKLILKIPNLVIRKLYVERIYEMLLSEFSDKEEARRAAEQLYQTGNLQPLCDFIEQHYFKVFDNRDYRWVNELTIKTIFLSLLFNDTFYIMDSETALERRYSDLTMIVRPDMRQYQLLDMLLEFKYLPLASCGLSGEQARQMSEQEVYALAPVKENMAQARTNLRIYRDTLQQTYSKTLRLRVYSVVAVGFERLVWEELKDEIS